MTSEQILKRNINTLRSKAAALPRLPGVYIMKGRGGNVIYVGKSRSLRDRVYQYFHGAHDVILHLLKNVRFSKILVDMLSLTN